MAAAVGGCKAPCFSPRRLRPRRCRPTSATVRRTFFRRRGELTKPRTLVQYALPSSIADAHVCGETSPAPTREASACRTRYSTLSQSILRSAWHARTHPTTASHRIAQLRTACFVRVLLARPVAKRTGAAADSDANCRFAPHLMGASLLLPLRQWPHSADGLAAVCRFARVLEMCDNTDFDVRRTVAQAASPHHPRTRELVEPARRCEPCRQLKLRFHRRCRRRRRRTVSMRALLV